VRNAIYPGHAVSWRFTAPAKATSVAILIPDATRTRFTVIGYNLDAAPVKATMTAWQVEPGQWEVTEGIDANGDDRIDGPDRTRVVELERSTDLAVTFAPRTTTVLSLKLVKPGTPYWTRPDLGIDTGDVKLARASGAAPRRSSIEVTVHNVGSVASPASSVGLVGAGGTVIATAAVPAIDAPLDLVPKTARVTIDVPAGTATEGLRVVIDPHNAVREITRRNNVVRLLGRGALARTFRGPPVRPRCASGAARSARPGRTRRSAPTSCWPARAS
jgi:predicted NUDIX family NTP pyrophosphohydrolase